MLLPSSQPAQQALHCAYSSGTSTILGLLLLVSFYRYNYRNYRGRQQPIENEGFSPDVLQTHSARSSVRLIILAMSFGLLVPKLIIDSVAQRMPKIKI